MLTERLSYANQQEVNQAMLKIERILCPVDFSDLSAKAYHYAYSLARHYQAKLLVQHVVERVTVTFPYDGFTESLEKIYTDLTTRAESQLRELVAGCQPQDIQPELIVKTGFVSDCILSVAEQQPADLIVMGTHGRRGIDRLTLGSVTSRVLRTATCPVLAIRNPLHDFAGTRNDCDPVQMWKILFCTDFSDNSDRALRYALSLATEYQARLTLVHVLEELPTSTPIDTVTAKLVQQMEKSIPSDLRHRCELRSIVRIGKAHEQIVQLILESRADIVVMGVRGRSALDLALFGSTTDRVLQLGTCPVFVVPPEVKALRKQKGEIDVVDSNPALCITEG